MGVQTVIGSAFLACGLAYGAFFAWEMKSHPEKLAASPAKLGTLCAFEFAIYFLCTLGVSDFLLNTLLIGRLKLAEGKSLPANILAATIVPGAFIAFSYLKGGSTVDALTLVLWMLCLTLGGALGGRAVSGMDAKLLKRIMGAAIIASMGALIFRMIASSGAVGTLTGLRGGKLIAMCVFCVALGFINVMGVPGKPAATAMLLVLGLSPVSALTLTLVLGSIIPMSGGVRVAREGLYDRKLVLAAMTAGSAAAILGVLMAVSLDPLLLNILLLAVMLTAVISLLKN
ncbi:MAG: hypothetical protein II488_00910 [Firmicutes bacterium]|nr:hypothetical protein [Bacillota bacterium]MBQ2058311.1 hypothetical protein [Bacillota bacterium]MBQ4371292.1 hypothetical protein [Bacillota bacterium]